MTPFYGAKVAGIRSYKIITILLGAAFLGSAHAQSIVTVAGGGTASQQGLAATSVIFSNVRGLAADRDGNIYISESDANVIFKVNAADGTISTYAGTGGGSFSGDNGLATQASLKAPAGIVFDSAGNLYIADQGNGRVRRIDAVTKIITTFAGSEFDPNRSGNGDNGPATSAVIARPTGLAWRDGNLYVTDTNWDTNTVRKIDSQGIITTVAGQPSRGAFSGDNGIATNAEFAFPAAVAADASGNLYIADTLNDRVRRVDAATKIITTVVGGGTPADDIGDDGPGTDAKLSFPQALALDAGGNLLIADSYHGLIRKYNPITKTITRVAGQGEYGGGDDGPAKNAGIYASTALTIDSKGNIFVEDSSNASVRRIDATTQIITRVAGGGNFIGDGRVGPAAVLHIPMGLALDASGNLIIADPGHSLVRKVAASTGIVSTIAGLVNNCCGGDEGTLATQRTIGFPVDVAIGIDGLVYFSSGLVVSRINADETLTPIAGLVINGDPDDGIGDNGPATSAHFYAQSIHFDATGNLYIADYDYGHHHRIRKVDAGTKRITTLAGSDTPGFSGDGSLAINAQLDSPHSVVVDRAGNLFIADTANGAIRRIDAQTHNITTYAGRGNPSDGIGDGGQATDASITPMHMAIDRRNDDLYFADQNGHRVRKIDAVSHVITSIAGKGIAYWDGDFSGDNGPARDAKLNFEYYTSGIALDTAAGRVFVSDTKNERVRMINSCVSVTAPILTAPAPGATTTTGPTLKWTSNGASHYDVLLDTVSPPLKVVAADLAVSSFIPSNLQAGVQYFWSVVAKGDPFCAAVSTATSAVSVFTTTGVCSPGAFDAISPAAGSATNTPTVTLTWQASARSATYDVYFGTASPPPLVATGLTGTTYTAAVPQGSYSWFIVAHAECDPNRTLATPVRSFQSSAPPDCVPGELQVTLVAPAAGATNQSATVELSWSANKTVSSYDVYFGTSQTPPLLTAGVSGTRQVVNGLAPGTTYFWRVVARGQCDPNGVTSATRSFTTRACETPGAVVITFTPPPVSAGSTYTLVWSVADGLDTDGGYLVERSTSATFASGIESQVTSSTAASFLASSVGTYYHRVRAIAACDPTRPGTPSPAKSVVVTAAKPNVVFTLLPTAVVAALGEQIENRKGSFALENLGTESLQVIVGRQELGSPPFFSIVDPTATDAAFVTLEPHVPKTLEIRYAGPPNNRSASYQGVIFVAATGPGLAVTPYAFVNLKVGGGPAVAPRFSIDGVDSEYAAFPGFAGDDTSRQPRTINIVNPGTTPMDLAAEIGPEVWLIPEVNWNATPLAPGESRPVKLFTRRSRSPNGSPLPRYTYFTVRTKDGASARLLVQDNDDLPVTAGRSTRLDLATRSFIVPEVVSRDVAGARPLVSRLRLTNVGGEAVQAEIVFTPAGADGFDVTRVARTTVVLPPNDLLTLTDPLLQLFHLSRPASGTLEVRIPRDRLGLVAVTSAVIGGHGGYVVPTVNRGEGARTGSPHVIAGISSSGPVTTSLTLAETSGVDGANVRVAIFDNLGTRVGETTASITRYGSKRFDSIGSVPQGRLDITVEEGGGSIVGMSVVGSVDAGATLVSRPIAETTAASAVAVAYGRLKPNADTLPSVTTVVPVLAKPVSAGASPTFVTSVGFLASTSLKASFVATYRSSSGGTPLTRSFDVAGGGLKIYSDVVSELFGLPSASGTISVDTASGGKVHAVLQSGSKPSSALPVPTTLSESLTSAVGGGQRTLFYDGLEQSIDPSRGTRWMLVLNEVSGSNGIVNVRLYESGNRSSAIAEKNIGIGPYEQKQIDTVFSELGLDAPDRKKDRTNVQVVVTAIGGNARVAAMAVSVDNQTADTKTFTLAPSVGSATPSVTLVKAVAAPPSTPPRRRGVRH